jgi:hypothetical protein
MPEEERQPMCGWRYRHEYPGEFTDLAGRSAASSQLHAVATPKARTPPGWEPRASAGWLSGAGP